MSLFSRLLLVALAGLAAGCANWSPAYKNLPNQPPDQRPNSLLPPPKHNADAPAVAVIEFGELGSYHDASQVEVATRLIRKTDRPLVVTFVHGWHNNSRSADLTRFRCFLERLAAAPSIRGDRRTVVGIYFAWNGSSLTIPGLNVITIWDRKRAAERLAGNGDCLGALLRIGEAARKTPGGSNFVIGHSLGGLIVERALAHTFLTQRYTGGGVLPWNLAVILNPASDAVLTRQLMAGLASYYRYEDGAFVPQGGSTTADRRIPENRPTIVEITSESDGATGRAFPASAWLAGFWKFRWPRVEIPWVRPGDPGSVVSERQFSGQTQGHNELLVNYLAAPVKTQPPGPPAAGAESSNPAFDVNLAASGLERTFWTSSDAAWPPRNYDCAKRFEQARPPVWRQWIIRHVSEGPDPKWRGPRVPLWNLRVPGNLLISGHNDIWSDNTLAMLAAIYRLHNAATSATPATHRRVDGETSPFKSPPVIAPAPTDVNFYLDRLQQQRTPNP